MTNSNTIVPATESSISALNQLRSWEPLASPSFCYGPDGERIDGSRHGQLVFRSDDTSVVLGQVGAQQSLVSNAAKCELFEQLVARGVLKDVRCGQFKNGARVYIQGQPTDRGEVELLPGHVIKQRLTLLDSYDGSSSLAKIDTARNVVCDNQFHSLARGAKKLRHTRNIGIRFEEFCREILASVKLFEESVEQYRALIRKPAGFADLRRVLDKFFPLPVEPVGADDKTQATFERRRDNQQRLRNRIAWAHDQAPGAQPGSRYGIYQAATYWLTHERGRDASRDEQNLNGEGARLNRLILGHLLN